MEIRDLLIILSMTTLMYSGFVFGRRFIVLSNNLLGWEWYILGFSTVNAFLWYTGISSFSLNIAMFCDAFSRSFGIPVIGTIGFLRASHGIVLTRTAEILLFGVGVVVAAAFLAIDYGAAPALDPIRSHLPVIYLANISYSLYMFWLARKLIGLGKPLLGVALAVFNIGALGLALTEGTVSQQAIIPTGDGAENLIFNFLFLSHLGWALLFGTGYYAYRALLDHGSDGVSETFSENLR